MKKNYILLFIFILSLSSKAQKLVIAKFVSSPVNEISCEILKIAYKKIGCEVEFVEIPGKRALIESNKGTFDGETHRIKGIDKEFTNLMMIEEPINEYELVALSKEYDFYIDNKEKLKEYQIGIRPGIVIIEDYAKDLKKQYAFTEETNLDKLLLDRIDFIITIDISAIVLLKNPIYKDIKILSPPLQTVVLYHYLHKKHAELVPKITKTLREMKETGEFEKIRKEYLDKLN